MISLGHILYEILHEGNKPQFDNGGNLIYNENYGGECIDLLKDLLNGNIEWTNIKQIKHHYWIIYNHYSEKNILSLNLKKLGGRESNSTNCYSNSTTKRSNQNDVLKTEENSSSLIKNTENNEKNTNLKTANNELFDKVLNKLKAKQNNIKKEMKHKKKR